MTNDEIDKMLEVAIKMRETKAEIIYISPDKLIFLINRIKELEILTKEK